jgi:hypothetical protein
VNSSSGTTSLIFIVEGDLLLNRYSPDFILDDAKCECGPCGLDVRIVFLGGLGPRGDIGWALYMSGVLVLSVGAGSSNSGPREKGGGSQAYVRDALASLCLDAA